MTDALWSLLPSHVRRRDELAGGALRELLAVITDDIGLLEDDLAQLYDDQFIETCANWVVPYIGELVGYRGLNGAVSRIASPRADVADTIRARRRKGTASMLEEVARNVTASPTRVIECFERLATTQFMNHLRPRCQAFVDVRDASALERFGSPFENVTRLPDLRAVDDAMPRWNLRTLAIFLWPMRALSITDAPALKVDNRRWRFSSLGIDVPLFARPLDEDDITHLAELENVPAPIGRRALAADIANARSTNAPTSTYYGANRSLAVTVDGRAIPATEIWVCNLSDVGATWAHLPPDGVAIDPVLGRIALPASPIAAAVNVSWHHGTPAAYAGGEYDRAAQIDPKLLPIEAASGGRSVATALAALSGRGAVEVRDNRRERATLAAKVATNAKLELRAADGFRPTIVLDAPIEITSGDGGELTLSGLVLCASSTAPLDCLIRVRSGATRLGKLTLRDCTLVPGHGFAADGSVLRAAAPAIIVDAPGVQVTIERSIVGGVRLHEDCELRVEDSVIDATSADRVALCAPNGTGTSGSLTAVNTTIVGAVRTSLLRLASNCIFVAETPTGFTAPIRAERRQAGCVRFSWLPPGAIVPRRFRCVSSTKDASGDVRPRFASMRFGDPRYLMLVSACSPMIRTGADDGGEMGAMHQTFRPARIANLRARLDEQLRAGFAAGVIEST